MLDLTNVLSGPFGAYHLGQLGAEVIKVEMPDTGDLARQLGADEALGRADALISELRLDVIRHLDAGQLSGGQMKLLEFGVCFMVPPRIALLDEPFAAVRPTMKEIMGDFIRSRHEKGQTFILVSHDMPVVVELCPRSVCMNAGAVVIDATTREVLNDPRVIEAYLGGQAA